MFTSIDLPFSEYIDRSRALISERRTDLQHFHVPAKLIVDANSPFELVPDHSHSSQYGALLLHGLFDCPFSLKDIAFHLKSNGILSRSVLLPGHGTKPDDLLNISYREWIEALHYGTESLKHRVEKIFLIGYSTGATLSVYQALLDKQIAGVILLAPALKIKAPLDLLLNWRRLIKWIRNKKPWVCYENEIDYTRYRSIAFNPIIQLTMLIRVIKELMQQQTIRCPVFIATSREDETISSKEAIHFFSRLPNQKNRLLLYSTQNHGYSDPKILTRIVGKHPPSIQHFSHISIPIAPNNSHYGEQGDYFHASRLSSSEYVFGAYNRLQVQFFDILYNLGIAHKKRCELTYNPDFNFMVNKITEFILEN